MLVAAKSTDVDCIDRPPSDASDYADVTDTFQHQIMPARGQRSSTSWLGPFTDGPIGVSEVRGPTMNPSCDRSNQPYPLEHAVVGWLMDLLRLSTQRQLRIARQWRLDGVADLPCRRPSRRYRESGWERGRDGLQGRATPLILYLAAEGHPTMLKAAELLGIGRANVRNRARSMPAIEWTLHQLREAIAADREAGYEPLCVAASAGTASTGAVDPLDDIADICAREHHLVPR